MSDNYTCLYLNELLSNYFPEDAEILKARERTLRKQLGEKITGKKLNKKVKTVFFNEMGSKYSLFFHLDSLVEKYPERDNAEVNSRKKELKLRFKKEKLKSKEINKKVKTALLGEAKKKYRPEIWLNKILTSPSRYKIVTHVGKFTHPDCKVWIAASPKHCFKEYLCTGSFTTSIHEIQTSNNAADRQEVDTLLGRMPYANQHMDIIDHIKNKSFELKNVLKIHGDEYDEICEKFINHLKQCSEQIPDSDSRLKQVYFPVGKCQYRLLSLLPSPLLIAEISKRYNERKWRQTSSGSEQILFIDCVGKQYGYKNPQNISPLNKGTAQVLKCFPPSLNRTYRLPKKNFFTNINVYRPRRPESGEKGHFQLFESLHNTLTKDPNTLWARRKKKGLYRAIIEYCVIVRAESIRENAPSGWTMNEMYSKLSVFQKRWLDPGRWRESEPGIDEPRNWQDEIARQISYFVRNNYKRLISSLPGEQPIEFSDAALEEIKEIAKEYVQ